MLETIRKGPAMGQTLLINVLFLFPVVPNVLHIIIVFHDVDELLHQRDLLFGLQLLIVLGNHFNLGGKTLENRGILNFFVVAPYKMALLNIFLKTPKNGHFS
jgi:hypothetical protein